METARHATSGIGKVALSADFTESDLLFQRIIVAVDHFNDGVIESDLSNGSFDTLEAELSSLRHDLAELRSLQPA